MWFLFATVTFIVVLGIYLFDVYKYWERKSVRYVKPLPIVGNLGSTILRTKALSNLIRDIYNAFPNERLVGYFQFLTPVIMLRDPKLIKLITIGEFDTFPQHNVFVDENVDPLWSKNLVAMKGGEKWHYLRSVLSPAFTSSKMQLMFDLMKNCARQLTKSLKTENGIVTVEMKDLFNRYTNDVIGVTEFGVNCNSFKYPKNEFYRMGKEATDFTGTRALCFLFNFLSPTLVKLLGLTIFPKSVKIFFSKLVQDTLSFRGDNGTVRPDMIHLLMQAKKTQEQINAMDSSAAKEKRFIDITDEDIAAQALLFFAAGYESAATLMSNMAYEMAVNPEIQQNLYIEINSALSRCDGEFDYKTIKRMKYLDQVVSANVGNINRTFLGLETLRKWPSVAQTDRMPIKSFEIEAEVPGEKPILLEANTPVVIPIFAIHNDSKFYVNPERFDPERFNAENKHKIRPYTYLPFGCGPRMCIGSRFAIMETKLILAEIISKFEIVTVEKTPIPIELAKNSFMPIAENGTWLGLRIRRV